MESETTSVSWHGHDFPIDRARLVRFCLRLTGEAGAAEDLAQETLLRAWQHLEQLRDPERRDAWLKTIARNLHRRTLRDRSPAHRSLDQLDLDPGSGGDASGPDRPIQVDAGVDLEVELDRHDLATLLDRAMALLPVETRQVLVERFVEETPLAETARRLGLSEGAVAMRLSRGKLALRRVLVTAFPDGLESYGIDPRPESPAWKATRIWCPWCGCHRLEGILARDLGVFRLCCPACGQLNNSQWLALFRGTAGHRAALARLLAWSDRLYQHSQDHLTVPCHGCGALLALRKNLHGCGALPALPKGLVGDQPVISYYCPRCRGETWNSQYWNVLGLPEARRFWHDNPRMSRLPDRAIECQGHPAIATGFVSRTGNGRLEVVYARGSLRVLKIQRDRT